MSSCLFINSKIRKVNSSSSILHFPLISKQISSYFSLIIIPCKRKISSSFELIIEKRGSNFMLEITEMVFHRFRIDFPFKIRNLINIFNRKRMDSGFFYFFCLSSCMKLSYKRLRLCIVGIRIHKHW